ncbi:unnamed protein product [Camellia sinensis]
MAASSSMQGATEINDEDWRYTPLLKAALKGDWDSARRFLDQDPDALTANITLSKETALHIAVKSGRSIEFVKELVDMMPAEALELGTTGGTTALQYAAWLGNTKAAVILVDKHPASLYMRDNGTWLPLHWAARFGHKDTLLYLLCVTKEDDPVSRPFACPSGVELLSLVVSQQFYDIALNLIGRYPELATSKLYGHYALEDMAFTASTFPSGSCLNRWQRLIYSYVPVKLENYADQDHNGRVQKKDHNRSDIENAVNNSQVITQTYSWARLLGANFSNSEWIKSVFMNEMDQVTNVMQVTTVEHSLHVSQKLQVMLWKVLELLVPHIKRIKKKKLMHLQAIQLVKCMCEKIRSSNNLDAYESLCKDVMHTAARLGIREVVEEIIESFPQIIWLEDADNHNIFQLAVIYRCENVFSLLFQMSRHTQSLMIKMNSSQNSILHLAGQLAPPDKLNLVPGAALQMQRELQWYKEVEKFVRPYDKELLNKNEGEIPSMIFTREHKTLVKEGEKWMKVTANSCTIAAALIATIAFAAIITVPGGNNNTSGFPVFSKINAFIVFIVSDAISLFTSTTSLLMFLSILTSRYAEGDFLYVLPKRLIIGLATLFLSITTMIIAFSSALYLVFGNNKEWILIPMAALACLPITSFVSLQFPLLVDLISSTYGHGIFRYEK